VRLRCFERVRMLARAGCAGAAMLLATAAPAQIGRVPVAPQGAAAQDDVWVPGPSRRDTCVDAAKIRGAVVINPRTVELVMKGGARWRLLLQNACPQLSYYGGFYYSQAQAGKICARDRIVGRAGGECRVARVIPLVKAKRR